MSNPYVAAGYGATNELAPDAWKEYMMKDLDVQDQNFHTSLMKHFSQRVNQFMQYGQQQRKQQQQSSLQMAEGAFNMGQSMFGGAKGTSAYGGTNRPDYADLGAEENMPWNNDWYLNANQ